MSAELSVNQIETGPSEQDWCKIHNTTTTTLYHRPYLNLGFDD